MSGNVSSVVTFTTTVQIDKSINAPTISLAQDLGISSTDGVTSDGTLSIKNLEVGASWAHSIDGGLTWETHTATATSATVVLNPGSYEADKIQVKQTDTAGNASAVIKLSKGITVDTMAPSLNVEAITTDLQGNIATNKTQQITYHYTFDDAVGGLEASDFVVTNGNVIEVRPVAQSGLSAEWDVMVAPAAGSGNARILVELNEGSYTDLAGNAGAASSQELVTIYSPPIESWRASVQGSSTGKVESGSVLTFAFYMPEAVDVNVTGGSPVLTAYLNGSKVVASYTSGSGTDILMFKGMVPEAATKVEGQKLTFTGIDLKGGVMTYHSTGAPYDLAGVQLPEVHDLTVDFSAPVLMGYNDAQGDFHAFATEGNVIKVHADSSQSLNLQLVAQDNLTAAERINWSYVASNAAYDQGYTPDTKWFSISKDGVLTADPATPFQSSTLSFMNDSGGILTDGSTDKRFKLDVAVTDGYNNTKTQTFYVDLVIPA